MKSKTPIVPKKRISIHWIVMLVIATSSVAALAYDGEWPPKRDPSPLQGPAPGLEMGEIKMEIPSPYAVWFKHLHKRYYNGGLWYTIWPTTCVIGDFEGPDDGDLNIVMYTPNEFAMGARIESLDWINKTASLHPLWYWIAPGGPGAPRTEDMHDDPDDRTAMIWDLDNDGSNEIIIAAEVWNDEGGKYSPGVYVMKYDPDKIHHSLYQAPKPTILAKFSDKDNELAQRLHICRMRDTTGPRDIMCTEHMGGKCNVLSFIRDGDNFRLEHLFHYKDSTNPHVPHTLNSRSGGITHEFNCADVDDDGYDEIFIDGMVDFVDRPNGIWTPTNGAYGKTVWQVGHFNNPEFQGHTDMMLAADIDPDNLGLEVWLACDSDDFWNPSNPVTPTPVCPSSNYLWNSTEVDTSTGLGIILRSDLPVTNNPAPSEHPQWLILGNWAKSQEGLEALFVDKGGVRPSQPDPYFICGFASDHEMNKLAFDGGMWHANNNMEEFRMSGPAGWRLVQIDWDGDYSQDEIVADYWGRIYVWRMGQKNVWETPPAGMPPLGADLTQPWIDPDYGDPRYWFYYQGFAGEKANEWGFSQDPEIPAGAYSHYWEKLGEAYAGPINNEYYRYTFSTAYDMGRDYREEVITINYNCVRIYFNPDTLEDPWKHSSPTSSITYKKYRNDWVPSPFIYQAQPTVDRIEITPATFGLNPGAFDYLTATAYYPDGSSQDVTAACTWHSDREDVVTCPNLPAHPGGVINTSYIPGSARITATLGDPGEEVVSEAAYVYVGPDNRPEVLSAGFKDSYLLDGDLATPLRIEARVAQRDNEPLFVWLNNDQGAYWFPYPEFPTVYINLVDDGSENYGDEKAGDGIYSAKVPQAARPDVLGLGDNLLQIQACLLNDTQVICDPWPFFVKGSNYVNLQLGPEIYNNNSQGDSKTPKIKSCGFRGFKNGVTMLIEAQVIPCTATHVSLYQCWVDLGDGQWLEMTHQGDFRYTYEADVNSWADDTYLINVVATAYDQSEAPWNLLYSDVWPRVRVHADEP